MMWRTGGVTPGTPRHATGDRRTRAWGAILLTLLLSTALLAQEDRPRADAQAMRQAEAGLKKALRSKNVEGIAYWVEILGQSGSERALRKILAVGERFTGDPVRTSVINTLSWAKGDEALAFYEAELGQTRSAPRAILIVEALARIDDPRTVAPLAAALASQRDSRVLVATVRALRYKPTRDTIDALITFYPRVAEGKDTLWAETRITMQTLTGQTYLLHEDWVNWWSTARAEWKPSGSRGAEEKARTAVFRPAGGSDLDLPQLFGQEIASKRVMFVIDTSKSMREPFSGDSGEEGSGDKPPPTRLERAKRELIGAIAALRKDVKFGVIAYNTRATMLDADKLLLASERSKRRAYKFIESWQPDGYTNTEDAVMLGLGVREVDTLILLSDGSPTHLDDGTIVKDLEPMLERITAENRFRGIQIHTLGFEGAKVSFMRALAKRNNGTYAPIR